MNKRIHPWQPVQKSGRANSKHKSAGLMILALTLMLLMAVASPATCANGVWEKEYPEVFRFGVLNQLEQVNQKDAQVAIEMNLLRRYRDQFPGISVNLEIVGDVATAAEMFRQKRLHGISLSGIDYLFLKEQIPLIPLFISSRQDNPLEAYLLVAPKNIGGIEQLTRMSRRRLIAEKYGENHIGRMWLDTVLRKKGLPPLGSFFTSIQLTDKPARMVLPVFFGQAEASLVPESVFGTMAELNPQISSRLVVLLRSPGFVRSINCAIDDLHPAIFTAFKKAVDMPETTDGQQLMMIFQYKRLFEYDLKYIQETEAIYQLYKKQASSK